ncbi:FtsX-like permease family protein [Sinomonas albida]|uniref:FtsX-like permease family protein n=1 Tax=Sinomonas albida TaxID=369942 RepID=UPI00301635AD
MLRVALSQLTSHARRFVAIVLAVLLAVGFLTGTLIMNASTTASLVASVGQDYAKADLVVSPAKPDGTLTAADAAAVARTPGVAASYPEQQLSVQATAGSATVSGLLRNLAPGDQLEPVALTSGAWPTTTAQVAVDAKTASARGLHVGSTVTLAGEGAPGTKAAPLTISGIMAASSDPQQSSAAQFAATEGTLAALAGPQPAYETITVALVPGSDRAAVASALDAAVHEPAGSVMTPAEKTIDQVKRFTGGADRLTVILLAFAAVALLVAGLVVANTFSVLIAQRTRELALLRCVGAGRNQIRASVILEALVTGCVASVLGVGLAIGVVAVIVAVLAQNPEYRFATLAVPLSSAVVGLATGTALAVLAALLPARAATRVSPLAALRPADEPSLRRSGGRVRLAIGATCVALGGVGLGIGAASNNLLLAVPAGAVTFVGVGLAATFFVPRLVTAAGLLASPAGVPGRMAAVNAVRNPRRTTATASALIIGVTLVSMMMTGAATAQDALATSLDRHFPVDISVQGAPGQAFTAEQLAAVAGTRGVEASAVLRPVGTVVTRTDPKTIHAPVYEISSGDARAVVHNSDNWPVAGSIVLPRGAQVATAPVQPAPGAPGAASQPLPVRLGTATELPGLVLPGTVAAQPGQQPQQVWIAADPTLDATALAALRTDVSHSLGVPESDVSGAVIEKATFSQVISTLLMVVVGLLAVAVLIALIGVANTLSLSVLERTRENSLLRALGLNRGQLRGMLALEALLVAVVAAIIGTALGVVYGWLGALSAIGSFATVTAVIPWLQIAGVVAVAAVAGLAASVIPARRAARLSPVVGLATE